MSFFYSSLLVAFTAFFVTYIPNLLNKRLPPHGEGFAAPGWRQVADIYREQLDNGEQRGGGISVFYEGKQVVAFTGGYAHYESEWKWEKDTLSCIYSSTKAVSAVAIALLVQRGFLDYKSPVKKYWPEFRLHNKGKTTVEELLSHQAGLPAIDEEFSAFDLLNQPEKIGRIIGAQKPIWKPGDGHGYHGFTLGLYEDQLVRRVDPLHRSLSQFFAEEIAQPFGLDVFIGLPKEENYRTAFAYPHEISVIELMQAPNYWNAAVALFTDPYSIISRAVSNPPEIDKPLMNNPLYREIPSPSTHGFATVHGLGNFMGILANGGADQDVQLLEADTINLLNEPLVSGLDLVLLNNQSYGRGVSIKKNPEGGFLFGAPGHGGQVAYADPEFHLGWAHVTNHPSVFAMGDDPKYLRLEKAIYECAMKIRRQNEGFDEGEFIG
ncbi:hypothetical protein CAPTEDRAFT_156512 [Capitella teleta]|uniref:Beta-lactamase-related domain-containing protein n=1 Tax=Capitella teleta TaxID=283909 RepID=R7V2F0_CAPTE|nr:hypothetical protein CAPTEDRAFT_156512 [Capitella teleta]|eukprot:ELU10516.1 hypothetical protein CAPTEDRAFT_156512 [Capitella teleta]